MVMNWLWIISTDSTSRLIVTWIRNFQKKNDSVTVIIFKKLNLRFLLHSYSSVITTCHYIPRYVTVRHSHESSIYGKYKKCTVTKGLDWARVRAPTCSQCRIEVISQGIERERNWKEAIFELNGWAHFTRIS